MKLLALAESLGVTLHGDPNLEITGVAGMEHAAPGHLTFLANPKYAPKVKHTQASAILAKSPIDGMATLVSSNPYLDFSRAVAYFYQAPRPAPGISPLAYIAPTAVIGANPSIGPFVSVGEHVQLGDHAVLHPHVVIYEGARIGHNFLAHAHSVVREFCQVGDRVILQNNVVIGGDGFGFAKDGQGRHQKIAQSGVTIVEDDVEVQSLSNIDRASVGETRVKRGAKVDSLVQVGHGCVVGEDNILCAQVGLAGSTILEKNVLLAGQVGISGHLTVHDNVVVYAQSGVGHDVPPNTIISGSPAFDYREWRRSAMAFPKLGELVRQVRHLESRLAALEGTKEPATTPDPA